MRNRRFDIKIQRLPQVFLHDNIFFRAHVILSECLMCFGCLRAWLCLIDTPWVMRLSSLQAARLLH